MRSAVAVGRHSWCGSELTAVGKRLRLRSRQEFTRSSVCTAGLYGSRSAVAWVLLSRSRRWARRRSRDWWCARRGRGRRSRDWRCAWVGSRSRGRWCRAVGRSRRRLGGWLGRAARSYDWRRLSAVVSGSWSAGSAATSGAVGRHVGGWEGATAVGKGR